MPSEIRFFRVDFASDDGPGWKQGIEYDGKLWMILEAMKHVATRATRPLRMLRIDTLPYQPYPNGFLLALPIPKLVLEGQTDGGFEVLQGSAIPAELVFVHPDDEATRH